MTLKVIKTLKCMCVTNMLLGHLITWHTVYIRIYNNSCQNFTHRISNNIGPSNICSTLYILTESSWFINGNSLNCENIPPVYCSSSLVASMPQLTGPRAKISAFILSAPWTLPNSLTPYVKCFSTAEHYKWIITGIIIFLEIHYIIRVITC